jgi:hypothetical protein
MVVEKKTEPVTFILAVNLQEFSAPGSVLLKYTKTGEVITGIVTAKQKAVLSLTYLVWKHSYQVLKLTLSRY